MCRTGGDDADHVIVDGLPISFDAQVLRPRPWTAAQGRWAAELARQAPSGAILELFAGAGHIGLVAARRSGRRLVQVDADGHAVRLARANATAVGVTDVEVRHATLEDGVRAGERFPVVIADPPYLPTSEVSRFPDDPRLAVDGGADGLDVVGRLLETLPRVLGRNGAGLLQLRGPGQVAVVRSRLPAELSAPEARHYGPERSVLLVRRSSEGRPRLAGHARRSSLEAS